MENSVNSVLLVVDDTRSSRSVLSSFQNLVRRPQTAILLYVQRLEGRSLLTDMLGDAEMSTLKDALKDSEHKRRLDETAEIALDRFRREIEDGRISVKSIIRAGHPAEEILKVADEEHAELIIMGGDGRRGLNRFISGNFAKEVQERAKVPVLVAKRANLCEEPYTWRDAVAAISVTAIFVAGLYILGIFLQGGKFQH